MPALEARGVELSYGEEGDGAPIVLVHETGTGSAVWGPVIAALGSERRAIVYDRRGWGASTVPDGYRRTTIEEQSEDAAVLIDSLGAAPAGLCGAGLGAVIALDLLLRRPELVSGAVLLEPPVLALVPAATEVLSEDRLLLEDAYLDRGVDGVVGLYLAGGLGALGGDADRLPTALTAEARERPAIVLAELGAAVRWSMPLVRLASAERPSLIVTSRGTPPLLREAAAALAARLAGSESREAGRGGPPHVGAPGEVAELVAGIS